MDENEQTQFSIELDEKTAQGVFSNLAMINHSPTEFIVDFISVMPGVPKAKVRSRIILTPQHAKNLLKALNDNITKYEKTHGVVVENEQYPPLPIFGVKGEA